MIQTPSSASGDTPPGERQRAPDSRRGCGRDARVRVVRRRDPDGGQLAVARASALDRAAAVVRGGGRRRRDLRQPLQQLPHVVGRRRLARQETLLAGPLSEGRLLGRTQDQGLLGRAAQPRAQASLVGLRCNERHSAHVSASDCCLCMLSFSPAFADDPNQ